MLTGLYPNSTGILANAQLFRQTIPSAVSLPQAFRLDGYLAVRIGTPYHYNVPNSIGTNGHDDPSSWEIEMNPAGCDRMTEEPDIFSLTAGQFGGTLSWLASKNPDVKHTDGMEAADAEWVLEHCAKPSRRRSHRTRAIASNGEELEEVAMIPCGDFLFGAHAAFFGGVLAQEIEGKVA